MALMSSGEMYALVEQPAREVNQQLEAALEAKALLQEVGGQVFGG